MLVGTGNDNDDNDDAINGGVAEHEWSER